MHLAKTDVAEMVLIIKLFELLLDILISLPLILDTTEFCVNNDDYTLLVDVMWSKHVIDYSFVLPTNQFIVVNLSTIG